MSDQIEKLKIEIKEVLKSCELFPHQAFVMEFERLNSKSVLAYFSLYENLERIAYREFKSTGRQELIGDSMLELRKDGRHGLQKKLMKDFLNLYPNSDYFKKPFFLIIREHDDPTNCGITEYLGTSEFAQKLHDKIFKK